MTKGYPKVLHTYCPSARDCFASLCVYVCVLLFVYFEIPLAKNFTCMENENGNSFYKRFVSLLNALPKNSWWPRAEGGGGATALLLGCVSV